MRLVMRFDLWPDDRRAVARSLGGDGKRPADHKATRQWLLSTVEAALVKARAELAKVESEARASAAGKAQLELPATDLKSATTQTLLPGIR